MITLWMTGLSGAGKTTLANILQTDLMDLGIPAEVIDADFYRKNLCHDLGFSAADRKENLRRLAGVAEQLRRKNILAIVAAINPFEDMRSYVVERCHAKIIWIQSPIEELIKRDPKGLYRRATLPDHHPDKLHNLSGINDPYELPAQADLVINTHTSGVETCSKRLLHYVLSILPTSTAPTPRTDQGPF